MSYTVVATVGENMDSLFLGIREFPTKKVILLTAENKIDLAKKVIESLEQFKIETQIKTIKGSFWEGTFKAIKDIKDLEGEKDLIINTAAGDGNKCAVCSAAFVNGIKAFTVNKDEIMMMPLMKFSFYKVLTDKKLDILKFLYQNRDCCASLEQLSRSLSISLPLVSYHINGNLKSEGLKTMGLVMTEEFKGKVSVNLTLMGKLMVKGYL